jgi:hypothetical protein
MAIWRRKRSHAVPWQLVPHKLSENSRANARCRFGCVRYEATRSCGIRRGSAKRMHGLSLSENAVVHT